MLAAVGCEESPRPDEATAATAEPVAAEPRGLDGYCRAMCKRSAECGLELAKREAGMGDEKVLADLARELPESVESCRAGCAAEPLDEASRFQLERAEICLKRPTCDELSACVAAL